MSPKNKKLTVITTRDQAEAAMALLRVNDAELQNLRARQAEEIAGISNRYLPRVSELSAKIEETEGQLESWAKANPKEFAGTKTIALRCGSIIKRLGGWTLELRKGFEWGDVLKIIKLAPVLRKKYLRTTEEVNKQALIADREKLDQAARDAIGVDIIQKETITVQPKED